MESYWLSAKLQMQRNLVLRGNVFCSVAVNGLWLLLYKMLWSSIYANKTEIGGLTLNSLLGYYLLVRVITAFTSDRVDRELSRSIMSGSFVSELIRPVNILWYKTSNKIGANIVNILLLGIPTAALGALILPVPVPKSAASVLVFLFCLILGFLLQLNINMLAGVAAFWVKGAEGITHTKDFIVRIASGALLPLSFLPVGLQKLFQFLPFRYIAELPVRVYQEGLSVLGMKTAIIGVVWCAALMVLNHFLLEKGTRKLAIYGG